MTYHLAKVKYHIAIFMWMLILLGNDLHKTCSNKVAAVTNRASSHMKSSMLPVLLPRETVPQIGSYDLIDQNGSVCIKGNMGLEYMVTKGKPTYFNIDPVTTKPTGFCGENTSVLLLTFNGGNIEFTFVQKGGISYLTTLRANLQASYNCKDCKSELFTGMVSNTQLFQIESGHSYKCNAQRTLEMAHNLKIKITNMQIQAFQISNGTFGPEHECWTDYIKEMLLFILGGCAVGICLILLLAFLILRENSTSGYERI